MKRDIRKKKKIRIKKSQIKTSGMIFICFVVFCAYCVSMVWQSNSIISMDSEIRALQEDYEAVVRINDDLQGQIMQAKNLTEVDDYATNVLGMVKADNSNIGYVSFNTNDSATAVADQSGFMSWLSDLIN